MPPLALGGWRVTLNVPEVLNSVETFSMNEPPMRKWRSQLSSSSLCARADMVAAKIEHKEIPRRVELKRVMLWLLDYAVKSVSVASHLRTCVHELPETAVCHKRGINSNPICAVDGWRRDEGIFAPRHGWEFDEDGSVVDRCRAGAGFGPESFDGGDRNECAGWSLQCDEARAFDGEKADIDDGAVGDPELKGDRSSVGGAERRWGHDVRTTAV